MGIRRNRHDPFIADGGSLVDRAILGHGVYSACTDQQVCQARSMRRCGRKQVLVHLLLFLSVSPVVREQVLWVMHAPSRSRGEREAIRARSRQKAQNQVLEDRGPY